MRQHTIGQSFFMSWRIPNNVRTRIGKMRAVFRGGDLILFFKKSRVLILTSPLFPFSDPLPLPLERFDPVPMATTNKMDGFCHWVTAH